MGKYYSVFDRKRDRLVYTGGSRGYKPVLYDNISKAKSLVTSGKKHGADYVIVEMVIKEELEVDTLKQKLPKS